MICELKILPAGRRIELKGTACSYRQRHTLYSTILKDTIGSSDLCTVPGSGVNFRSTFRLTCRIQ